MPPFTIEFKPSQIRRLIIVMLTLATLSIHIQYFSGSLQIIFILATSIASFWAWQEPKPHIHRLTVNTKGQATIHIQHHTYPAILLSGSLISRHICFCRWHTAQGKYNQILFPDSTDSQSARKFRIWARLCQARSTTPK